MTRLAPVLAALVLGVALVLGAPAAAPAREQAAHVAGVTVSFGSGRVVHRTVTFSGDSITGLDALRGAGFDVEVYGFSGIGGAVCRIDGVGRSADSSCLNGGSEYWAYWHDGRYSSVGAGASQVHDRDQEQWAWGAGDHAPPTTAFAVAATTRPATPTTTVVAPAAPPAVGGDGPSTPTRPGDPAPGSSTTGPGPSTTAARHGSTTTSSITDVGDSPGHAAAKDEEAAAGSAAPGSGSGGGGGGPLAIAGFVIVLAAVVGLTLRARSARGNAAPRN